MSDKLDLILSNTIKVWNELLKPRTIFAFLFYLTFCYLIITKREIPQELNTVVSVILGFYFGQRVAHNGKDKGVGL